MYAVNNLPSFTSENCKLLCDDLCNIFKDSSRKTFGESTKGVNKNCKGDKPWFGTDCKRARYTFHKARKKYNVTRLFEHKVEMVLASKAYRRTVNKYVNMHKKDFQSKLRQMQSKQPKYFLRLVNGLSKKKLI